MSNSELPPQAKAKLDIEGEFGRAPVRDLDLTWSSMMNALEYRKASEFVNLSNEVQTYLRDLVEDEKYLRFKKRLGATRYCVCKSPQEWKTAGRILAGLKKELNEMFIKITPISRR